MAKQTPAASWKPTREDMRQMYKNSARAMEVCGEEGENPLWYLEAVDRDKRFGIDKMPWRAKFPLDETNHKKV